MGAAFGGGSSGSLVGSAGSANFLSRTTAMLATVFFLTSIALTWFGSREGTPQGVMDKGVMDKGVMERTLPPATPTDVPQPAAAGGAGMGSPAAGNAPAGNAAGSAVPAPGAAAPAAVPGQGEVPK
jgi:preprotein translocase subunit SecG